MSKKNIKLTEEQSRRLKELSNIGSMNAMTALSNFMGKNLEIPLSNVEMFPFVEISEMLEDHETEIIVAVSDVIGDDVFSIIQIFSKSSIVNVINNLSEKKKIKVNKINKIQDLDDYSTSIVNEFSNIIAGHYANALADIMGTTLIPGVPEISLDNCKGFQNDLIKKYSTNLDDLVFLSTNIIINELNFEGILWFIPNMNSLEHLFSSLGIYDR